MVHLATPGMKLWFTNNYGKVVLKEKTINGLCVCLHIFLTPPPPPPPLSVTKYFPHRKTSQPANPPPPPPPPTPNVMMTLCVEKKFLNAPSVHAYVATLTVAVLAVGLCDT